MALRFLRCDFQHPHRYHHNHHKHHCRQLFLVQENDYKFLSTSSKRWDKKDYKPRSRTLPTLDTNELKPTLLPTYYFQKSLPRLPIPKLELTCQRYLEALQPILSMEQWGRTNKIVNDFQNGVGSKLHRELMQKDRVLKQTSYISGPWFEMYLKDRSPLPINSNPGLVFVEDDQIMIRLKKTEWQLVRSVNLLISSLRFMLALETERLEPEVFHLDPRKSDTDGYRRIMRMFPTKLATYGSYLFKAFPLDMSQFPSLFRSTRIPQIGMDKIHKGNASSTHIILMRKGHCYSMNCFDSYGNILPIQELMGAIQSVLIDNNLEDNPFPIGIMTTEDRDTWATFRQKMISKSSRNQKFFKEIDTAILILSLDDDNLGENPAKIMHQYLHATGTNRWFDKSFNLITTKDGWAGLNFEHAWGDGVAVMRFFNDVDEDSKLNQWCTDLKPRTGIAKPVRLVVEVDEDCSASLKKAKERFNSRVESLDIHPFILEKYGKQACKQWGISPDSLMQLGFQIAYHRMTYKTVTTYESCSTSAFRHGRTEAIRPATQLTKEISEIMSRMKWENHKAHLHELIIKCSQKHGQLTRDAAMAQGFDRHLFAMKNLCMSRDEKLHDLYLDESYRTINHNILSTSTLSSPAVRVGGFGPVAEDGMGIAYQIWDTGLGCITATNKGKANGSAFVQMCHSTFNDIHTIMTTSPPPQKTKKK